MSIITRIFPMKKTEVLDAGVLTDGTFYVSEHAPVKLDAITRLELLIRKCARVVIFDENGHKKSFTMREVDSLHGYLEMGGK